MTGNSKDEIKWPRRCRGDQRWDLPLLSMEEVNLQALFNCPKTEDSRHRSEVTSSCLQGARLRDREAVVILKPQRTAPAAQCHLPSLSLITSGGGCLYLVWDPPLSSGPETLLHGLCFCSSRGPGALRPDYICLREREAQRTPQVQCPV